MEITQMKYFLEVAKTQHMTQSANKLHIAQPALTQSIHRLENELGVPLFLHKGRNIVFFYLLYSCTIGKNTEKNKADKRSGNQDRQIAGQHSFYGIMFFLIFHKITFY